VNSGTGPATLIWNALLAGFALHSPSSWLSVSC
jgi:hypothetical protein